MPRATRALVAAFDAIVMAVAAGAETGRTFALTSADLVLWGSALAAALSAFLIWSDGSPELAWVAIGYVLFGALLTHGSPHLVLLGLAVALMPLVPRPRASIGIGLAIAVVAAFVSRIVLDALL